MKLPEKLPRCDHEEPCYSLVRHNFNALISYLEEREDFGDKYPETVAAAEEHNRKQQESHQPRPTHHCRKCTNLYYDDGRCVENPCNCPCHQPREESKCCGKCGYVTGMGHPSPFEEACYNSDCEFHSPKEPAESRHMTAEEIAYDKGKSALGVDIYRSNGDTDKNMPDVMRRVDQQVGQAVRRLGER